LLFAFANPPYLSVPPFFPLNVAPWSTLVFPRPTGFRPLQDAPRLRAPSPPPPLFPISLSPLNQRFVCFGGRWRGLPFRTFDSPSPPVPPFPFLRTSVRRAWSAVIFASLFLLFPAITPEWTVYFFIMFCLQWVHLSLFLQGHSVRCSCATLGNFVFSVFLFFNMSCIPRASGSLPPLLPFQVRLLCDPCLLSPLSVQGGGAHSDPPPLFFLTFLRPPATLFFGGAVRSA